MPTRIRTTRGGDRVRSAARPPSGLLDGVVAREPFDEALEAIRAELQLPDGFPPEVLAAAEAAVADPRLPAADLRDLELFTIDPPGATDLDQAMHLERLGGGYRVHYAIADVPAFVQPGSPVDDEARRRGQTLYAPDRRVPLHPKAISEGAASLLPGQDAPAFVWVFDLDADARTSAVRVQRAMVRSRAQLDYESVQAQLDAGTAVEALKLLREVGGKRIELERERGGAALAIPDQEVVQHPDGYELRLRPPVPVEGWNAQISLMTGMAAAGLMVDGAVGLLRTMPAPDAATLKRFRLQAVALGVSWPADMDYQDFLRSLNPQHPQHLALLHESASLFRGAAYTPVLGTVPEQLEQAAVAAPYAHVTAPLRRLVDRFGLLVCEALCRGEQPPDWVVEALPQLPEIMRESDRRAGALERDVVDAAEAAALAGHVGASFPAVVVDVSDNGGGGLVQVTSPPVLGRCDGVLELGEQVQVRLVEADPVARKVRFEL
ncbi:MAG TPA: RNB domain-containing ribonuclease [Actinomycetales bacterium]|nr:RNB domain-containing ribonuclease [Actinomycetales bacterium]